MYMYNTFLSINEDMSLFISISNTMAVLLKKYTKCINFECSFRNESAQRTREARPRRATAVAVAARPCHFIECIRVSQITYITVHTRKP